MRDDTVGNVTNQAEIDTWNERDNLAQHCFLTTVEVYNEAYNILIEIAKQDTDRFIFHLI